MKNCEEMVKSLLERRDWYNAEKRRRKKAIITRTAASMCCICLAALLGAGLWKDGAFNIAPAEQTPETTEQTFNDKNKNVTPETDPKVKSDSEGQEPHSVGEVKYITMGMTGDWPVYQNVKELTDAGNVILLGKIADVSFEFTNPYLYTNYCIEVITSYKGDAAEKMNLRLMGGIEGAFIDEQKEALGDRAEEGIPLAAERPDLKIGKTYLFVLYKYEDAAAVLVNLDQSAFSIDDPLAKDVFSYVSAKDIISFFGKDQWASFERYKAALD